MINEISEMTGLSVEAILHGRNWTVSCIRQLYWKLLREKKRHAYRYIAELNKRSYSVVYKGIRRANELLETGDKMTCELWNKMKGIEE